MNISLRWLNSYLEPSDVTAQQAEEILTFVGFPIESHTALPDGDTVMDVEVTSNRGDCLSHLGLAREIAAASGRKLKVPSEAVKNTSGTGGKIDQFVSLENREPNGCPLFTLRLIRGVKIGPSPKWMVERLAAVGQRSINNVVDCTNYLQHELGSPSHVFDLANVAKGADGKHAIVVRSAAAGEKLTLLDGKSIELKPGELVVADAHAPSSLAGIMGGAASGVSEKTTDVLVEVATWAPGAIRKAARRLGLRTDASYRFERLVSARTIEGAAQRLVDLLLATAGGTLAEGVLSAGRAMEPAPKIAFRPERCRRVLGAAFSDEQMRGALTAQGVTIEAGKETWSCTPPTHRPDIKREEDLIEEVARTIGLDKLPVKDRVDIRVVGPQESERAVREISRVLTGLAFFETVTFSFVGEKQAKPFLASGMSLLAVSDERRKGEGTLRPSVLPSLLGCRRANQHAKSAPDGTVRLFELGAAYGETKPGAQTETANLTLLADVPAVEGGASARMQAGVRLMRGVIEAVVHATHGEGAELRIEPATMPHKVFEALACGVVKLGDKVLGVMGIIAPDVQRAYELDAPVVGAELNLAMLIAAYPPRAKVHALPLFPGTERDLSLVVDEATAWAKIEHAVRSTKLARMESLHFVGTYRGKPLEAGKKSVTLRMVFRDAARTLRDEEVNADVQKVVEAAGREVGAVLRV